MDTSDFGSFQHVSPESLSAPPGLLGMLTAQMSTAILLTDENGFLQYLNPAAENMTGFALDEIKGLNLHDMMHHSRPDGSPYPVSECCIRQAIQGQVPVKDFEETLIRKDKTFYPVKYTVTPLIEAGKTVAVIHEVRDWTKEKQIEQAYFESEQRFEEVVNNVALMVIIWDQFAHPILISQPWLDYTGLTEEHAFKAGWHEKIHPEDRDSVIEEWRNAFVHRERFVKEYRIEDVNGQYRWFYMVATPRYTETDKFSGFYATTMDIHDKKQAELALKASESKFRRLYDSNMIGLMFWDLDGTVIEANDAYLDMIGYTQDDVRERRLNWRDITPIEWAPADQNAVDELQRRGSTSPFEKQYVHKNGQRIDILLSTAFMEGSKIRGFAYVVDITERKRIERELLENEEKLRQISESGLLGIVFSDIYGAIFEANEAASRMLGYPLEELNAGQVHFDQITPLEYLDADFIHNKELFEKGHCTPYEKQYLKKDGSRLDVLVGYALIPGSLEKTVCFIVDITERKHAERALIYSESRFRCLYEAGIIGITTSDRYGNILDANAEACRITGYSPEDIRAGIGRWDVITPPEYLNVDDEHLKEMSEYGFSTPYEKQFYKEGHRIDALVGYAFLPGSRNINVSFLLDITEKKQMERVIQENEARFRNLANISPAMLWMSDDNGEVTFVSNALIEHVGVGLDGLVGDSWRQTAFHPDDAPVIERLFEESLHSNQAFTFEGRMRYKAEGQYHWMVANGIPWHHPNGNFAGFVGSIVDIDERKKWEIALQESEAHFRKMADMAPVMLWQATLDGMVSYVSEGVLHYFHLKPEELLGEKRLKQIHPEDVTHYYDYWTENIRKQVEFSHEFRIIDKEGQIHWLLETGRPTFEEGECTGYIGSLFDITKRKQAEAEIKESEEYFRYIVDIAPVMLWMSDQNTEICFISQGLLQYFDLGGISKQEFYGTQWLEWLHPDDRQPYLDTYYTHFEKRENFTQECRLKYKDDYRWVLVSGSPRYLHQGEFAGYIGSVMDITERKEAEIAMRETEAYFRETLDTAPVNLWMADTSASTTFVSKGLADFLGKSKDDLMEMKWPQVVHPDDKEYYCNAFLEHIANQDAYMLEGRFLNKDNEYRWILSTGMPRYSSSGEYLGFIGTIMDITERKEAEISLKKSEEYFRYIADTSPIMLWMAALNGQNEFVSKGLSDYFGIAKENFAGFGWLEAFHPDDRALLESTYIKALSQAEPYIVDARARTKTGEYRWVTDAGQPRFDEQGKYIGFIGTVTDIQDRKEALLAIQKGEERFRYIADAAPVMLWMLEGVNILSFVSQGICDYLGITKEQILGAGWVDRIHPDDLERYVKTTSEKQMAQEPFTEECRVLTKTGEYHWMIVSGSPRYNDEGVFEGYIGSIIDNHQNKMTELALQEEREYFRESMDTAPIMLWITDERPRNLTFVSKGLADFIGVSKEKLLKESWLEYIHPEDVPAYLDTVMFFFDQHIPHAIEVRIRNKDDAYRWALVTAQPQFSRDNEFLGYIGTLTDITERKLSELATQESEAYFRYIVDIAPVMLWMSEADGSTSFVSQGLADYFGLDKEKFYGDEWYEVFHPDDWVDFYSTFIHHIEHREACTAEARVKDKYGNYRWILDSGLPRYDLEGNFVGFIGTITDITEKKNAELLIKQGEERFRLMADAAPIMLFMTDMMGRLTYLSKGLLEFLGAHPEETLGEGPEHFIHPNDVELFIEERNQALQNHSSYTLEFRIFNQDGMIRWVQTSAQPRFTEENEYTGYVGTFIDITERKLTELELQESELRFRLMADAAPVMIWIADEHAEPTYFNRTLLEFLGLEPDAVNVETFLNAVHPDDRYIILEAIAKAPTDPVLMQMEIRLYNPILKEYRWILSTSVPRSTLEGAYAGSIGSSIDITDYKKAQEEIQNYARRLEQSNKELEEFATIASHDLQAPLRKIAMFSGYIQETSFERLTDEGQDYFNRILASVDKMQQLLNDLLDLSRINRKGRPFLSTNMNKVAEEVLADLQFWVDETQGTVEVGELCTIDADALQIHQLLQNLISNALKFSRENVPPMVKIYRESLDDRFFCHFVVEDNGIGFKEEQAEYIFDPFVRLHGAERYEGTGMGLAICRKIVERHGGNIRVTSTPAEGSRFYIALPFRHTSQSDNRP